MAAIDAGQIITKRDKKGGVTVESESTKWGYIDRSGKFVIEPRYELAQSFCEERAAVKLNGLWGFIDKDGQFIVKPKFSQVSNFYNGLAVVGQRWKIDMHQ